MWMNEVTLFAVSFSLSRPSSFKGVGAVLCWILGLFYFSQIII